MSATSLQERLLVHVQAPDYRPAKPAMIARRLRLDEDESAALRRLIRRLVREGTLKFGPKHYVLAAGAALASPEATPASARQAARDVEVPAGQIVGTFRRASGGYGFVTQRREPDGTPPPADVFIPEIDSADAADGDLVRIRLSRHRGRYGRHAGEVIEVVQRHTYRFVGTYRVTERHGVVTIDGGMFAGDVLVGDAGAKNCRPGDKVVVEMVRFPRGTRQGEAAIVQVLGPRGEPGVDTQTIVYEFGLPQEFPEEVLEEARRGAEAFDESDLAGRSDFRGETVITIDPAEARDFDDAISLRELDGGHWQLGVHIADVSHFVREGSPLDVEARRRGTSVYLPDRVIPMLPETLSNHLASLQPDRVRFTLSAVIEFDPQGRPIATELHRSAIRSRHRFNYEEIDDYLSDDRPWSARLAADVFDLVRRMHTLAMILRARRMERGAIELVIPEVRVQLDDDGRVRGAVLEPNTESHQIIEEFMLAANQAVARQLIVDRSLHILRRIHEPPTPLKLRQLTDFVHALGVRCESLQSRFEIRRLIAETAGTPLSTAVNVATLRSMQKAIYSPRDVGHYALHAEHYCHFTSPIRRYPDLVIHRMVHHVLDGRRPRDDFAWLTRLGEDCSELEQRAERAERDLTRLKLLNYLFDKIGLELDATITGVESFGLFALCEPLPVDGLIPVDMLPRDRYAFDRVARALEGFRSENRFRIGDRLRVRVALVDPDRRELELELVGRLGAPLRRARSAGEPEERSAAPRSGGRREKREPRPSPRPPRRGPRRKPRGR